MNKLKEVGGSSGKHSLDKKDDEDGNKAYEEGQKGSKSEAKAE